MSTIYALKNKIILGLLFTLCIVSIQFAYAEPQFSFKIGSSGTGDDQFNRPTDVIAHQNGREIYVVDSDNHRISVFKSDDGRYNFQFGSLCDVTSIQNCNSDADGAASDGDGQFNKPMSITSDSDDIFYIVDTENKRVQIIDEDGKFRAKFGSSVSSAEDYLGSASGIVIQKSTENILVSNTERDLISVFDSNRGYAFKFNTFNTTDRFQDPKNMVMDNSKEILYVADSGNDRIVAFKLVTGTTCPSGTTNVVNGVCLLKEFGSVGRDEGEFNAPAGLAYNAPDNLLYVADTNNDRIQVFKMVSGDTCPSETVKVTDGVCFVEKFGTRGSGNGEFKSPMGIAFDKTRKLLMVADTENNRVQAFSFSASSGPGSSSSSEPTDLLPGKPKNLKASPTSPTSIILSWVEPEMGESIPAITGYKIEYKVGTGAYITITENTTSKTTSFIHEGLESTDTHHYRVYSLNSNGTSEGSANDSTKPEHTDTPTSLTATAIAPSQIRLSWLPPSETYGQSISGYQVKRELTPGVYDDLGNTNSGTMSYIVTGLRTDKTYTFAVSAKIGAGYTEESPTASATPREDSEDVAEVEPVKSTQVGMEKSSPPIKLTASVVSSTQIDLSWSAPVKDGNTPITGYKIEVKKDADSYKELVADTKSTTTKYSHKKLSEDTKYTYKVSAINAVGTSESSNEHSATPKSANVNISPLGKLEIDEGKKLQFTVKLTDQTVKDVVFSLDKPPAGAKIGSKTGVFSWTPSVNDGGKRYSLDIIAKKGGVSDRQSITITVNDIVTSPKPEPKPAEPAPEPKPEPAPEPKPAEPKKLGLASFVFSSEDPQSYVDRYNAEPTYKKWFDDNFAEYDSIYQAVGLEDPNAKKPAVKEPVAKEPVALASFVDSSEDPQSYVDRYNAEPTYKKWFDDNFAEYDSIYQAVGLEKPSVKEPVVKEPVAEKKKFGTCGPGTELRDGKCTVISKPVVKPWWQFW